MGGGGKGGSSVQTVSIPPEVLARYNAVNARAENVATTPFTAYGTTPEAFVAPLSTTQQAGMANINALQGSANQAVGAGQGLQGQGIGTAQQAQAQAQGVNMAALQGIGQAQQQGTAYNQAAGQNIGNAMGAAAPFMQGNAALQQQGLAQQQGYQQAATQNIGNIAASAEPYLAGNAALQQQGLAQQQGYQQAATQNIGNAMGSASPYMQQMAGLTQAGLGAGQQYLSGATGLTQEALKTGQQMGAQAQPFYTGALQAAQPLNQQAQQYLGAGAQAVGPEALNYGQYMNPFLSNVVGAQQALQAQENAAQRSAMKGKAIQSGAFGGDRAGIEQANLARQQSLANQATLSNLLQSGFNQAQQQAAQQQGVSLGAAQANRAAQQQAAQQAAALGQQNYAQVLGVGQGLSALGQQQYAQQLGAGAQIGQLGQQGYQQALGAGAQLGQVGQNLYNQNIGQGQALAGLGQQGLQAMQSTGTNLGATGMNRAALQGQQGQALANLGQQGLAALQGTGTNIGNIGQQLFGQNITQGQAIQGLGQQQFAQGLAGAQGAAAIGQNMFGQGAQTAGLEQAGGMNIANLGLQNQGAQIGAAQAQMAAGQQQQQTEQAARTALYNQFLQQQGYPFQIAQFLGNLAMGTGSLSGSTTSATRTGYRGGRMGDGYASGGLVPPDSQGGAVYAPGLYARGGYEGGGNVIGWDNEGNPVYEYENAGTAPDVPLVEHPADVPKTAAEVSPQLADAAKTNPALQQNISDYQAVSGVNKDVSSAFKDATGKDIDAASARKYQDMLNAGMSLDQVKYNINTSQPALLKAGDVGALKGQSLAYNPANFSMPSAPVKNQFGSYAAPAPQQASGKGASQPQPQTQPYYGQPAYNYGGGYSQPNNYGMPNFGNYGGAPNYAGAAYYGGQQQYGYQPQQPQQASGKGASQPQPQPTYQPPQATGKGASQPAQQAPTATGKGMSTGGRAAFASGGRAGYALQGGVPGMPNPGDPYGTLQAQQAMFAGAPGAAAGYVPPTQVGAGQYKMLTPQASILPQEKNGLKEAVSMGTSIASLGEAGNKLYDKLKGPSTTAAQDAGSMFNKMGAAKQVELDKAGGLTSPSSGFKLFGENSSTPDLTQTASIPDAAGKGVGTFAANGGRIGYNAGGIPGLDDLKQGKADIPGGEGLETPMSKVVSQGTQTPAELKGQMNSMSSGAGGLGGSGGGSSALGTAASIASLGMTAYNIGSTVLPMLMAFSDRRMKTDIKPIGKTFDGQTIHRYKYKGDPKTQIGLIAQEVEKAHPKAVGLAGGMKTVNYDTATREAAKRGHFADGGSAILDLENPQDQAMAEAFDNLLQRYDNNPLLAAAAMDVGTKAVDAAIMKAEQTGGEVTDFLPRRTQEYMFALSKAAMGAHDAMSREARKSGGRTGYALPGSVDDEPTGLAPAPAPSDAMTMGDVGGGLAPQGAGVQVAGPAPATDKGPDLSPEALRAYTAKKAGELKLDPDFAVKVFGGESGFKPHAVGDDNSSFNVGQFHYGNVSKKYPNPGLGDQFTKDTGLDARDPKNAYAVIDYGLTHASKKGWNDWTVAKNLMAQTGEQKPVQVATATGLAPKTDAGPFERTFGKAMPDSVPTDSSFWVPLIAGLGTMLASDKYRFSQRLGEGLVGGAAAYGKQQEFGLQQQKVGSEVMKNTLGVASDRFKPIGGGQWWDALRGEAISTNEYQNRLRTMPGMGPYMGAATAGAGAPASAPATTQPSTTQPPAAPQKTEAQPAATQNATAELPKSVADVQAIYKAVDTEPEVSAAKQAYQELAKKAEDPAIIASGQSTALRTQAAQALSVYNDLRNKYASVAMEEAKKRLELSPEVIEGKASEAAAIESAKNNIKYFDEQAAADQARQQTRVQLAAIRTILENYQSGTFAQEKAQLVGALRSAGITVPASATANPDAFEEFTKEMMKNVFSGVKEIGGQIRVAEMAGLEKASNNPSMQPEANKKVLAQSLGILDAADKRYADEVNAYGEQKNKFNRAKFQLDWRKSPENDPQKFISEAEKNTAVRGATPSDLSEMSAGHVYVIEPSNAFGVAIDKPQKLRFMGVNPETGNPRWQKVQ